MKGAVYYGFIYSPARSTKHVSTASGSLEVPDDFIWLERNIANMMTEYKGLEYAEKEAMRKAISFEDQNLGYLAGPV